MSCKQREERCLDALNMARMDAEKFATSCAEQHKSYAHGIYDIIGMAAIVLILTVVLWKMAEDGKWLDKLAKYVEKFTCDICDGAAGYNGLIHKRCPEHSSSDYQLKIRPEDMQRINQLRNALVMCEGCNKACSKSEIVDYDNKKLCFPCHKIVQDLERKNQVSDQVLLECDGCRRTGVKFFLRGKEGGLCNTCYDKENNSKLGEAKHQVQQQTKSFAANLSTTE